MNSLFELLALRLGFVSQASLSEALDNTEDASSQLLCEVLLDMDLITVADRETIDNIIALYIKAHDSDISKCVSALQTFESAPNWFGKSRRTDETASHQFNTPSVSQTEDYESPIVASSFSKCSERSPNVLDRFRFIRHHAEGGLGKVSLALDAELNREVALKEIKNRFAEDDSAQGRFVLEAEITGGLEHPGVVPVYGFGRNENGQPYYAMRFIRGHSLKDAAKEFHSVKSRRQNVNRVVEFRKLLGRFVDVCNAIDFAHSKGIVHRDIKPANIMLGEFGEALVVDWGLAKKIQRNKGQADSGEKSLRPISSLAAGETKVGSVLGTPQYMSPEQAAGKTDQLDAKCDIYSLGATLFYLIAAQPPVAERDPEQAIDKVRKGEYRPLGQVEPAVPRPLEAICRKAMSLEPDDRYASAGEMADDIERFLADESVAAHRDPFLSRVRRWSRKHPRVVASFAATLSVGLLSTIVISSLVASTNQQLRINNSKLTNANLRESEARRTAEANEKIARGQSQLALTTLTAVIQDIQVGLKSATGGAEIRRRLLAISLERLARVSSEFLEQVELDRTTMIALNEMGDIILGFGVEQSTLSVNESLLPASAGEQHSAVELALEFYKKTLEIAEELAEESDDLESQLELAFAYNDLARANERLGDSTEALKLSRLAIDIESKLVVSNPDNSRYASEFAASQIRAGRLEMRLGNASQAERLFLEVLETRKRLLAESPEDGGRIYGLSTAFSTLANFYLEMGNLDKAIELIQMSLGICEEAAEKGANGTRTAASLAIDYDILGHIHVRKSELEAAHQSFRRSLEYRIQALNAEPNSPIAKRACLVSWINLGTVQKDLGELTEALDSIGEGLKIALTRVASDPSDSEAKFDLSVCYDRMGDIYLNQGHLDKALEAFQSSLPIRNELVQLDESDQETNRAMAVSYFKVGRVQAAAGHLDDAIASFQRSLDMSQELADAAPTDRRAQSDLVPILDSLGDALVEAGQTEEAVSIFEAKIAISLSAIESFPGDIKAQRRLGGSALRIGAIHRDEGNLEQAIIWFEKALRFSESLATQESNDKESQHDLMVTNYELAKIESLLGNHAEAAAYYRAGVAVSAEMIEKKMDTNLSVREYMLLLNAAKSEEQLAIALGDWDTLIGQPAEDRPLLLQKRAELFDGQLQIQKAAQAASELAKQPQASPTELFLAARVLSRCASHIAMKSSDSTTEAELIQQQAWVTMSIATLEKCVELGWDDFSELNELEEFNILQDRPEFQMLMDNLAGSDSEDCR